MEKDKSLFVQQCRELEKDMAGLEGDIAVDGVINPEHYFDAPVHIMWVLKEANNEYPFSFQKDVSSEDWRRKCVGVISIRRADYASYGILKGEGKNWVDFPESGDPQVYDSFLDIAWVNLKKTIGGNSSDNWNVVEEYANKYRDIVKLQVEVYDPDVVIFCGSGLVDNLVEVGGFPGLDKCPEDAQTEGIVAYWTSPNGKLYIDAYHPSYLRLNDEDYVMSIVNAYRKWEKA